jgi:cytochrome c oxidase cbb3-type subunit III
MSDFTSEGWGLYVALIALISIIGCGVFLKSCSTKRAASGKQVDTTGHTWDEDLTEWNNPLPRWWMWLFYLTIVFSLGYLVLYPGLGTYQGYLNWSSRGEYEGEQEHAKAAYGPVFEKFLAQDLKTVAADPQAREMGQRLFLNYCSQCHGSDAGGGRGYPNLRDRDWLYGGSPEIIKASIAGGRSGMMPPLGASVGSDEDVKDTAHYVLKLAGRTHDGLRAYRGEGKFKTICAACHGPEGKGNQQIGAPNLTDEIWLHGGSESFIVETITKGRKSLMPQHSAFLDEGKIHLLAAYVYGLSQSPDRPQEKR